jgi:hypothetical protein
MQACLQRIVLQNIFIQYIFFSKLWLSEYLNYYFINYYSTFFKKELISNPNTFFYASKTFMLYS